MHINAFLEWRNFWVESSDIEEGLDITHSENSRETLAQDGKGGHSAPHLF